MLFWYLIMNIKKDETILVYHSLQLRKVVYLAKKIKKFNVILEVEEIYSDVSILSSRKKKQEKKIIESADKYIFSTELLNEKLNNKSKESIIIYGSYKIEEDKKLSFNDNKTHVVYAGTLSAGKGSRIAVLSSKYLSQKFHVHIIGFGSNSEIRFIKDLIEDISKKSKASVSYDGVLKDEKYINFLNKCDIGLCTQNSTSRFNATSFPSKILSYMANGLEVLSINIRSVVNSKIGKYIHFYEQDNPQIVADNLEKIIITNKKNNKKVISRLDKQFQQCLVDLIEKWNSNIKINF